ncbi:hypothetical protein CI109_102695 [Kwoniella shandongensis]|uniref:Uncharacterized protein n=1 Tax=Kwoniella shandongensis TaxID=1734106 RepID=A0A5M6BPA0_9TREE|nr:uncharacterized protein CI109_007104 [Kwoniella shandongensis]KAA5524557.1 hypothetical protein CI109_007104 [Kwoniella shandongensis]
MTIFSHSFESMYSIRGDNSRLRSILPHRPSSRIVSSVVSNTHKLFDPDTPLITKDEFLVAYASRFRTPTLLSFADPTCESAVENAEVKLQLALYNYARDTKLHETGTITTFDRKVHGVDVIETTINQKVSQEGTGQSTYLGTVKGYVRAEDGARKQFMSKEAVFYENLHGSGETYRVICGDDPNTIWRKMGWEEPGDWRPHAGSTLKWPEFKRDET